MVDKGICEWGARNASAMILLVQTLSKHFATCSEHYQWTSDFEILHWYHSFARLLFPSRCVPFLTPFIFFEENPRRSPVDTASPLFANRFLPPNPNFASFFCLLSRGAPFPSLRDDRTALSAVLASSSATSKRSSSLALPVSASLRSAGYRISGRSP